MRARPPEWWMRKHAQTMQALAQASRNPVVRRLLREREARRVAGEYVTRVREKA